MRNYILIFFVILLVYGCQSSQQLPTTLELPGDQTVSTEDIPSFYLNPPQADEFIYGVASARLSSLDASRRLALARAREDIAFQLNSLVESAIIDYAQETNTQTNPQFITFVETISRQTTESSLQGAVVQQLSVAKDGTVYVLVQAPVAALKDNAEAVLQNNQDAAFAEFKAEQALDYLDSLLKNSPPQAGTLREGQ